MKQLLIVSILFLALVSMITVSAHYGNTLAALGWTVATLFYIVFMGFVVIVYDKFYK